MKKILIVDDEPNILMSLEFLMKKEGYEVFIARDGEEAIEIIQTSIPDIVVLDIMMPKVDGFEVCKMIKSSEKTQHIKVVFLSAKTHKTAIQKGYDLGADAYVTKPFSTKFLVKKIKNI